MEKRDRVRELIAIKERMGYPGSFYRDDLTRLKIALDNSNGDELFASLLPARVVTLIEVLCRFWVQTLINHGTPYDERALDLKIDVKYDLPMLRSVHGGTISLGFLLAHSVKLSSIEAIAHVFTALLAYDFYPWLSKARDRMSIEHDGESAAPIIEDLDKTKRLLKRAFEVRHILVHEYPENLPFSIDEISEMIVAAERFLNAVDEGLTRCSMGC